MKKLIQIIGLISFIIFSFFYTDKVMQVVRDEDKIMIELKNIKEIEKVKPINAEITIDTMIPGLNGKEINIEKSYKAMKSRGVFNRNDIVYDIVNPEVSMINNKDKYIIMGNNYNQMVSIIFLLENNKYLDKIEKIINKKNITANYFVDYQYLMSNTTKIKELNEQEFYSYGEKGKYTPDTLLFSNNLISRISNNNANLCLSIEKEKKVLELCSKNDLYTIVPNIVGGDSPYERIKNHLSSGSIILLNINQDTLNELEIIIDYIKGKGLKIVGLTRLINERLE